MRFDSFAMVDWSGGNDRGAKPKKDAIWVGIVQDGAPPTATYFRNRQMVETYLTDLIDAALRQDRRLCLGFDFPFGYPKGFTRALTGINDPFALWDWLAGRVQDAPKANNRFDLAGQINGMFPGIGPFWGNGLKRDIHDLPRKGRDRTNRDFAERRQVEVLTKGAFTVWQLAGAGAVGSQAIMGLPVLARLRHRFATQLAVWPFEPLDKPVGLIEIWPSLPGLIAAPPPANSIRDAHQVTEVARILAAMPPATLEAHLKVHAPQEGWIFGVPAPRLSA